MPNPTAPASVPKKNSNSSRKEKTRLRAIGKNVTDSWEKSRNPNLFGGAPVLDPSGRIISIQIHALGFVAEVFEDQYVHDKLLEAFRKNNVHYKGFSDGQIKGKIKKRVESWPPKPKLPIFALKAYAIQSYFSQLIR